MKKFEANKEYKPSDRLRDEPTPTSGQVVPKLDRKKKFKRDKTEAKLSDRLQYTEKKLDKATNKLTASKPYKRGVGTAIKRVLGNEISHKIHGKISEVERENVGVESAHRSELVVERGMRSSIRYGKYRAQTRSKQQAAKWKRKNIKMKANEQLHQLSKENFTLKKNIFKRHLQKRRLRKQFQKQAKMAAKKGAKGITATIGKTIAWVGKFVVRHPIISLIIVFLFLIVVMLQSCVGGASTIGSGLGGAISGTSYLAEDSEINEVALRYTEWETDLIWGAMNAATTRPGYDEYRFKIIGNIGHNPFEVIAFLTTRYNDFTFAQVEPTLRAIFAEQYTLTHVSTTETRGSGEDTYTVRILTSTITVRSLTEILTSRLETQEEQERFEVMMIFKGNRQIVGSPFAFNWLPHVTSLFGYRIHPIRGERSFHSGLDIALPTGTEILAGGTGTVISADWQGGYGLTVVIDYGNGVTALYAHCSQLLVSAGQTVSRGEVIALVGSTGDSTGPHLHIEVRINGVLVNPLFHVDGARGD